MEVFSKNSGLLLFCVLAFAATVGISVVFAATPPGKEAPDQRTRVRAGQSSILMMHSRRKYRPKPEPRQSRPYRSGSRRNRGYSDSSRRGSVGNRSYRGGGLFGGK